MQFSTPLKEGDRETFIEYLERVGEEIELLTGTYNKVPKACFSIN